MKNVLIVDERFPYTGGTRTEKIVKYLPNFGWKPVILTIDQTKKNPFADDILRNYEHHPLKIYSTKTLPTFSFLNYFNLTRVGTTLNRSFYIPDTNLAWIPNAFIKAFEIFERENPHIIYSTSPNEGVHLVAYLLKLKFKKPWVADFRDLWTLCHGRYGPLTFLHHWINNYLERSIYLRWSDLVIANTDDNKRIIIEHFKADPQKIEVVTNGFDPCEIVSSKPRQKNDHIILGYFGAFDKPMTCHKEFLAGYAKAIRSQENFDFQVWAVLSDRVKRGIAKDPLLQSRVSFNSYLSHQESMNQLSKVDVLVVMLKDTFPYVVPQKLYNYLSLKKPILAIVPPNGSAAKVIKETNSGIVVPSDNINSITEALLALHKKWSEGNLGFEMNNDALRKYQSDMVTEKLCHIFDTLIDK